MAAQRGGRAVAGDDSQALGPDVEAGRHSTRQTPLDEGLIRPTWPGAAPPRCARARIPGARGRRPAPLLDEDWVGVGHLGRLGCSGNLRREPSSRTLTLLRRSPRLRSLRATQREKCSGLSTRQRLCLRRGLPEGGKEGDHVKWLVQVPRAAQAQATGTTQRRHSVRSTILLPRSNAHRNALCRNVPVT